MVNFLLTILQALQASYRIQELQCSYRKQWEYGLLGMCLGSSCTEDDFKESIPHNHAGLANHAVSDNDTLDFHLVDHDIKI